ncbi:MAG: FAD/NAD(P)-binding oxidoreductase [Chitinophagales bacterium]
MSHYQILIIGGGTAGITVAAQLLRKNKNLKIGLIEPSDKHVYQPAWTLVGAGTYNYEDTIRNEADYIPKGIKWIKDKASDVLPNENKVATASSGDFTYDYLVIAPGLVMRPELLEGLPEAMKKDIVSSVYVDPVKAWKTLQNFKGGNALFTQPTTPIKCGGAPQKFLYLSEHYLRKQGIRDKSKMIYATPGSVIFGVQPFAKRLEEIIKEKDVVFRPFHRPVKIDAEKQEVVYQFDKEKFENSPQSNLTKIDEHYEEGAVSIPYDMLHLAPPQSAPEFIQKSEVAVQEGNNKGWVDVDIYTLQHKRFGNIFALGDVAALPTAKTGAAIRKQAPVVVNNLLEMIQNNQLGNEIYQGYSSCPIITGYGKMLLAEFKYENVRDSDPLISKFLDTSKEQYSMWLLKKYGLPFMYWNFMLKGMA